MQPLLQWKSGNYYIFCVCVYVCVCVCMYVSLGFEHAPHMCLMIMASVAYPIVPYNSTLSHKGRHLRKESY